MREVFSAGTETKRSGRPVLEREAGGELVLRGVEVARLRNGLTLSSRKDDRFSQVLFRLEVKAGPAWEKPEEAGVSHLVEHMAFAAGEDGLDMYARAELCGGSVSISASGAIGSYGTYEHHNLTARFQDLSLTYQINESYIRIIIEEAHRSNDLLTINWHLSGSSESHATRLVRRSEY